MELWNDEMDLPLQHVSVVDLSVMLPAPLLTRLLSQYGADVVKIEALPKGDHLRDAGYHSLFDLANRGKRSLALDLKQEKAAGIIKHLVTETDVFVESFRDGVAEGLGLGYADLSESNPDLLYLSIRGFRGPMASKAGHDINFVANSGVGEWFLENGHANQSTTFADIVGGTLVPALRLLMHLSNPERRGMHIVCYIDEGFRTLFLPRAYETFKKRSDKSQKVVHEQMSGRMPHSRFYRCRDDRWVSLNAIQKKHWDLFCDVIDHSEWMDRHEDSTLVSELEKMFRDAPSNYWEALANQKEICLFRVMPWEEHLSYSQAAPQLGQDPLTWCGFSPNLSLSPAPKLGADTFAILNAMGFSHKDISEWASQKLILPE